MTCIAITAVTVKCEQETVWIISVTSNYFGLCVVLFSINSLNEKMITTNNQIMVHESFTFKTEYSSVFLV